MIAEFVGAGGVVVGAGADLAGRDADEGVVEALAAESGGDPAVVAAGWANSWSPGWSTPAHSLTKRGAKRSPPYPATP